LQGIGDWNFDHLHKPISARLFNHFIGAEKNRSRQFDAHSLGRFQNPQFKLGRLLDRDIGWLGAGYGIFN
jgi:hypothetical protein